MAALPRPTIHCAPSVLKRKKLGLGLTSVVAFSTLSAFIRGIGQTDATPAVEDPYQQALVIALGPGGGEVPLLVSGAGDLGLLAGGIEADHIVIELFGMRKVHLPFFELGGLQQFFRLVAGASQQKTATQGTEQEACQRHRRPFVPRLIDRQSGCLVGRPVLQRDRCRNAGRRYLRCGIEGNDWAW